MEVRILESVGKCRALRVDGWEGEERVKEVAGA